MRGPPGLPGPKGEPGERGYRGEKGTKGDTGSPGRFPRAIPLRNSRKRRMKINDIFSPDCYQRQSVFFGISSNLMDLLFVSCISQTIIDYIVNCLCVDVGCLFYALRNHISFSFHLKQRLYHPDAIKNLYIFFYQCYLSYPEKSSQILKITCLFIRSRNINE